MEKKSKRRIAWIVIMSMLIVTLIPAGFAFAKVEENGNTSGDQNSAVQQEQAAPEEGQQANKETADPNAGTEEPTVPVQEKKNGFAEEDGQTVFYVDDNKVTGFQTITDITYYFSDPEGYMLKGLQKIGRDMYYFNEKTGAMTSGIQTVGDHQYYFSEKSGKMLKGFRTVEDITYYFSSRTGRMLKGLQTIKGDKYYFDPEDGHQITGFAETGNKTRYFDPETGKMLKGLITVGEDKYYFSETNGKMLTGLRKINGNKYYFGKKTGKLYHGFKKIDGNKYYFGKNTGRMVYGFVKINGSKYYFGKNSGKMFTGLNKIGKNVYTFNKKGKLIRTVYADKKAICLTWDDGPSENTATIMKSLIDNDGRGTFFVCGNRVGSYYNTLKKNYKAGNMIGNHSWSHPVLSNLSAQGIKDEISNTNKIIKKYTGETPKVCRTPYGINTEFVRTNVNMPIILWSVDTLDWKTRNADSTYNSIMNNAKDGAVVLMHDLYAQTAQAAVKAIPALRDKGFQLVTVEEMALIKGYKLKKATVYTNF